MHKLVLALLAILLAGVFIACGDDDDAGDSADTETPAATSASATEGSGETRELSSQQTEVSVTFTAPGDWFAADDLEDLFVIARPSNEAGPAGFLGIFLVDTVYAENGVDQQAAPADLAEFISSHPRFSVRETREGTVSGLEGVMLEVGSSELNEWKLFEASDGPFEVFFEDVIRFYVLEGSGRQILVATGADQHNRYEAFIPLAESIIETMVIEE
jgi:hypothetical protein